MLGTADLIRFQGTRETLRVPLPIPCEGGNLAQCGDAIGVAIVDPESRSTFFRFDVEGRHFVQVARLEGSLARLDYESRRGRLAISAGIEFALLESSGRRVRLRELPPVALRWKRVTWHPSGDWIWRWGVNPLNVRKSELQLVSASDGALRATWLVNFKVGSAKISADGRFAAFGSADKARKGVAAEIYYLGEEAWD